MPPSRSRRRALPPLVSEEAQEHGCVYFADEGRFVRGKGEVSGGGGLLGYASRSRASRAA